MARLQSRQKSKPSDDWTALLSAAISETSKLPPGKGWKTFAELRVHWNLGKSKAREVLVLALGTGRVESFDGCSKDGMRLVRRVWYRIKK